MEQTALRAATLDDLRKNLESNPVPKGTGRVQDYEHAKRVMHIWRDYLACAGIPAPSYLACIRAISNWVRV